MVAIRNRTNNSIPYVFRYPKWEDGVFYPAGSLATYPASGLIDSEQSYWNFYTSLRDVPAGQEPPPDNSNWSLVFDAAAEAKDSEILDRLEALELEHDSDVRRVVHDYLSNDSDFDILIEEVVHNYLANDSDLDFAHRRDVDSDTLTLKDYDSDLTAFISAPFDYGSF